MQVKEADHDQILGDFLQSIAANKGMIANEKSMPILMKALKNSTLGSKATVSIAAALLKNATKYSEPTGRHVRGLFCLTQDDEDIDLFVLQAINGAQGRILNKDVVLDIHNLSAKASFTKEKLDVIGLALRANAEQFPLCKTECTAVDDIEVWAPKMRDFLKRIGFVDCTLAVEAIEVLHNRIQKPVPLRMIGSLINSLLVETFSVDLKVPLAERIMKLALVCVQPEEVDPIRSHVVCGFFALVDRATPNLVDFLTTEIYKTTKLALPKEAVGHMHHVVFESDLSGDQKKQITDAIESRTTKPKTTRIQNIKALLFSSNLEDKAVSNFILSEVTKCKEPILTPPDFERFVRKLDSEKVQSATKIEFITKLMENADL